MYEIVLSFILPRISAWRNAMINTTPFSLFPNIGGKQTKNKDKKDGKGGGCNMGKPLSLQVPFRTLRNRVEGLLKLIPANNRMGTDGQRAVWQLLLDITQRLPLKLASLGHWVTVISWALWVVSLVHWVAVISWALSRVSCALGHCDLVDTVGHVSWTLVAVISWTLSRVSCTWDCCDLVGTVSRVEQRGLCHYFDFQRAQSKFGSFYNILAAKLNLSSNFSTLMFPLD